MAQIIVVEDDVYMREELIDVLEKAGYDAVPLLDFENAVSQIMSLSPDLILLDINLPFHSGFEICKEVKAKQLGTVLILTARDVLIIGVILYKENISNIISAIRKITQIPIIILTDASSLLCMSWKKESIYAGADCVMDINSTIEEVDLQIFSLARRNNKQKITQKQSETMINKAKLVMNHKKHKVFWNNVALHLTRQEYNFLYLLAVTPMRVYTFEQIYQLVWKDYSVGDIKNIIWCLVKRLRKKLNAVEDGAGNCIVSVRDIGYKFELNKENEQQ